MDRANRAQSLSRGADGWWGRRGIIPLCSNRNAVCLWTELHDQGPTVPRKTTRPALRSSSATALVMFVRATHSWCIGEKNWTNVATHVQYPFRKEITFARIKLRVLPRHSKAFRGRFGFDSVQLLRSPRLGLTVDRESRVYEEGTPISVECNASG